MLKKNRKKNNIIPNKQGKVKHYEWVIVLLKLEIKPKQTPVRKKNARL